MPLLCSVCKRSIGAQIGSVIAGESIGATWSMGVLCASNERPEVTPRGAQRIWERFGGSARAKKVVVSTSWEMKQKSL